MLYDSPAVCHQLSRHSKTDFLLNPAHHFDRLSVEAQFRHFFGIRLGGRNRSVPLEKGVSRPVGTCDLLRLLCAGISYVISAAVIPSDPISVG